jgi:hypothetical protein
MESYCRVLRGHIRLARGDAEGALVDAEQALELGRALEEPQALYPSLAFCARVLTESARQRDADPPLTELLTLIQAVDKTPDAHVWLLDLALALTVTGEPELFATTMARVKKPTPWLEAARAIATGQPQVAAAIYGRIGAQPEEAEARVRAARALAESGDGGQVSAFLEPAAAFYRRAGARAGLEAAERLLASSRAS